jgi:hypothetical protein
MTSGTWIVLKDAGWVSVIGVICIVTFALSHVVKRHARVEASAA